ncbi:hypothetical protein J4456_04915 [Candidatus Pacearchaeota archaeon]|nr:hypothetical protein [Candidatus Pacearchaeota archaeon]
MKINTTIKTPFSSIYSRERMNKKAFRYADIPMVFLCFLVIGVGIAIGMYVFFSYTVDVRGLEAQILGEKLVNGLVDQGHLRDNVLTNNFNIYHEAHISKKIIDQNEHYFSLDIIKNGEIIKNIDGGNREYKVLCHLSGEKLPRCFSQSIKIDGYTINILSASNYQGAGV